MPFAFILIGILILITAINNTYKQFASQLYSDFTGAQGFLVWIAAIAIVGMVGYIPGWQTPSRAFLALIILAFFLSNKGVFAQFQQAIQGGAVHPAAAQAEPQLSGALPIVIQGGGAGGGLGGLGGLISAGTKLAGS